jgi:Na+-transporting methylmalonyl-CoA/oxaloacetate decarboxylase gamma subunit
VGMIFAILIPLFLVLAGIGAGAFIYFKKRKNQPTFNQFDLLEQDEADQMLD